jgi:hypothetical protein
MGFRAFQLTCFLNLPDLSNQNATNSCVNELKIRQRWVELPCFGKKPFCDGADTELGVSLSTVLAASSQEISLGI